jgi:hypothetical protein
MPNIDLTHAASLIQYSLGGNGTGTPIPTVGALHLRLMTVNGTQTTLGTELPTGGSYVAGTGITPVTFGAVANVSGVETAANSIVLTQVNMPAATIVGGELWDSSSTPHRLWQGALTANKVCNLGDTFSVAQGALTVGIG